MSQNVSINYLDINQSFGRKPILCDIELRLRSGLSLLLTGENGAGKTTLLKILSGLSSPDRGTISFQYGDIRENKKSWRRGKSELRRLITYLHQRPYMFSGSVSRNLEIALPASMRQDQRNQEIFFVQRLLF